MSTHGESARIVSARLHEKAAQYLQAGRENLAFKATQQALELESQLEARRLRHRGLAGGLLIIVLLAAAVVSMMLLSTQRPANGSSADVSQLIELVRELLPPRDPQVVAAQDWPITSTLLLVGILVLLGIVLYKLFSDKGTSGLTKVLALAVSGIAGTVALDKLAPGSAPIPSLPQIVYACIWGILVCVGIAILARREEPTKATINSAAGAPPQADLEPRDGFRAPLLTCVGVVLIMVGVAILIKLAIVPSRAEQRPALPPPPLPVVTVTTVEQLAEVQPFPQGAATLDDPPCAPRSSSAGDAFTASMSQAVAAVKRAATTPGQSVQGLMLMASADRDSLRGKCRANYDSNRALARARGTTVAARLTAEGISTAATVIPIGPINVATSVADDRAVAIYGVISRTVTRKE